MKKNALIVSFQKGLDLPGLEKDLLLQGFHTVRVPTMQEALFRLENEKFSIIICEDSDDGSVQRELAAGLLLRPFACTTPVIVLGKEPQSAERSALTSLLDQYLPVKSDPQLVAELVSETYALQKEKTKRGLIGAITFPQLLYQASQFRLNGAVVLERSDEKCIIYLEEGCVVFASSNRDENRFGEFLVQQGIISRDQLLHAIRILQKGGKRLGRILVDEGIIKPQVLHTLIQSQVKHVVFTVFDWKNGEFCILHDERSGQDEAIARFEVGRLILEGVRFKYGEIRIMEELGSQPYRVSLAVTLEECQRRVHLGKNEVDFLKLIGRGRLLEDILHLNSFSRLDSLRLVYSFRILGMLSFEKERSYVAKSALSGMERSRTVDELFGQKSRASIETPASPPTPAEPAQIAGRTRAWRIAYMVAGAGALALTITLLTLFDTRSSRKGFSTEKIAPPAIDQIHKVQRSLPAAPVEAAKIANPPPPSAAETLMATPSPVATPQVAMIAPRDTETFKTLLRAGERQRADGKYEMALRYFNRALRMDPENIDLLIAVGDTHFDLDELADAENTYERAKSIDPAEPRSYLALGTLYSLKQQGDKAIVAYRKYLNLVDRTSDNQSRIIEVQKILRSLEQQR